MPTSRNRNRLGRLLARREALAVLGASAGAAALSAYLPQVRWDRGGGTATAAEPCVVRPEQTEGPYFVDERLNRADIRSDPSDGSVKEGTPLAMGFVVQRLDGSSCVPLVGALVDLWHCDAAGVYSDVSDPRFDTRGQKFLRGYLLTDANGTARFTTIYPGWYEGRAVHMHFKVRTDPDAETGFEFTSQLYFDEAITDVVHAAEPYAAKGRRTVLNSGDGIFANGGDDLLLGPGADGSGGYAATFAIALQVTGPTTTTLPGGPCLTASACLAVLQSVLPDPAAATGAKSRRTARRLARLATRIATLLERAAATSGTRQAKRHTKARTKASALLSIAQTAASKGTLDVDLAPIEAAVAALLAQIPE
jgi:protocatechuate 3,4-dioxygenase beta subunit